MSIQSTVAAIIATAQAEARAVRAGEAIEAARAARARDKVFALLGLRP